MTKLPHDAAVVKDLTNPLAGRPRPIGDLMRQARQRLMAFLDSRLIEAGYADIGAAHVSVLATVEPGGSRLSALVERGGRTKQATAQLAGHLLDRGYLDNRPDPADGRASLYLLTQHGWDLIAAAETVVAEYEAWLEGMLGRNAVAQLRRALTTIADDAREGPQTS
jgi:DNA-binding MarR family transcriptional regulator